MDQERIKESLISIQKNFIENKTNQLILLGVGAILIATFSLLIISFASRFSQSEPETPKIIITPIQRKPKPTISSKGPEKITSASWSLNCQVVVTTTERKRYLKKFDRCNTQLQYVISFSGNYLSYIYAQSGLANQIYIYSLDNNVEAKLDPMIEGLLDFKFTLDNNLAVLTNQKKFTYYLIPLIYSSYPDNYETQLNEFTDVTKKKVDISLPEFSDEYASLQEDTGKINILDIQNKVRYVLLIKDLVAQIIPPEQKSNKSKYDWKKRLLYIADNKIKSMDIYGENQETHTFVCNAREVIPSELQPQFVARSPDGATLVVVQPSNEIAIFDLKKDICELTGLTQTRDYNERMAFSPNGAYVALVKEGVFIYQIDKKQSYKILQYYPLDSVKPTAITGPFVWSADSRFVCMAVSTFKGKEITQTNVVRAYFSDTFEGKEQVMTTLPSVTTPYTCSPDGEKVLYINQNSLYIYSLQNKQNSLYRSISDPGLITKLVWLRSGAILSNIWKGNDLMQFEELSLGSDFSVDEDGQYAAYTMGENTLQLFDFSKNKKIEMANGKIVHGELLIFSR